MAKKSNAAPSYTLTETDKFLDYFATEQGLLTIEETVNQIPDKEEKKKINYSEEKTWTFLKKQKTGLIL